MELKLFIVDANVLIDFCTTDASVLTLVTKHVGSVHVAEPVLSEVRQLDREKAEALGLCLVMPEVELLKRAGTASVRSPLRFQDWVCLLLAKERDWTCVTNDKRLRRECDAWQVSSMWGLQLLLRLLDRGIITANEAVDLAEAIHAVNRRISRPVVDAFIAKARR